jgi:hypothetical protein
MRIDRGPQGPKQGPAPPGAESVQTRGGTEKAGQAKGPETVARPGQTAADRLAQAKASDAAKLIHRGPPPSAAAKTVATRALKQSLQAVQGDGKAKTEVQKSLQGGSAQDARAARDWTNVGMSIFGQAPGPGSGAPTVQVDPQSGQVQFGDGKKGAVPRTGTSPGQSGGGGDAGATPITIPKPHLDPGGDGRVEQQALEPGGGGRVAQGSLRSIIQNLQSGDLVGAKAAWQSLGAEAFRGDVNRLIQHVLRESYVASNPELNSLTEGSEEGASPDVEGLLSKHEDTLSLMANMSRTFSDVAAGMIR